MGIGFMAPIQIKVNLLKSVNRIFHWFWLMFEGKLGPTIDLKSIQQCIEKKMNEECKSTQIFTDREKHIKALEKECDELRGQNDTLIYVNNKLENENKKKGFFQQDKENEKRQRESLREDNRRKDISYEKDEVEERRTKQKAKRGSNTEDTEEE